MKVIQTSYDRYLFRSRTEARWAVFFDNLNISWEYEKEGFELEDLFVGTLFYLPDFWLPNVYAKNGQGQGVWLEIKGTIPTETEERKCYALEEGTHRPVFLVVGIPPGNGEDGYGIVDFPCMFSGLTFCKCYHCKSIKIGHSLAHDPCEKCGGQTDDQHPDIQQAILAARQVRFEHGNKK